ncbi:MAG TPA: peptide-methionine (R)-S-oxide reductase MsrB [Rhodanobacteraceae bacterium]|jgi:peptide-methionine (R)-S-oxide reductase|nr:peptide-methionine (R)-S-oxide reductase MsrB [Rhodanobacteraceae bacterium]
MARQHATNTSRRQLLQWGAAGAATLVTGGLFGSLILAGDGTAVAATGLIQTTPGSVALEVYADDGRNLGLQQLPKIVLSDAEWHRRLSPAAFAVLRRGNTEPAFSGAHERPAARGIFRCAGCATALYDDATQFDSGTGWPSFWQPISPHNVIELRDTSFGMLRTEIRCARCDGHLGHVFHDGPPPTGLRYCMNALALRFVARSAA